MDWLFILFIVALGIADWASRKQAAVHASEAATRASGVELEAIKWARTVEDPDTEAERLREAIHAEENRELAAWSEFQGKWKAGLWLRFISWKERRSYVQPDPREYARREFFKSFTSRRPELFAKSRALSNEARIRQSQIRQAI